MKTRLVSAAVAIAIATGIGIAQEPGARGDRPWLGVFSVPAVDWDMNPMLLVREVIPDSPAEDAGLAKGDFIRAINGTPVRDVASLSAALDGGHGGDVLVLTVARGAEVVAVPVTLTLPTQEQRDALAARRSELAAEQPAEDEPHMVFIPQRLCLVGVTFGEAFAMSLEPGLVTMDVNDLGSCRHPVDACAPVSLEKQTKTKTLVARKGVRYKLKGDWRAITHQDREKCLAAIAR